MDKKTIMDYFEEKYKDNEFIMDLLKGKDITELKQDYKRSIKRDKKENSILENGTLTYTIDFDNSKRNEVKEYMMDNNMFTMFNGEINYNCGNDGRLLGVPIEFIEQLKRKFEIKLSREMYILGKNGLKEFKIGDRVEIVADGIFGKSSDQGTVYNIKEDKIVIRKYRSKTKGYTLKVGDECYINKIKKFKKVS